MKRKNYGVLKYDVTVRNVIVFTVLLALATLMFILDPDTKTAWYTIVIPFVIEAVFLGTIIFWRRFSLNLIRCTDLDMKLAYELDKRKDTPKNREHNLMLMTDVYFYNGNFERAIECGAELLNISKKDDIICTARHNLILSHFLAGNYSEALKLIGEQRNVKMKNKNEAEYCAAVYDYIELYLNAEYEKAIEKNDLILSNDRNLLMNSRKVLAVFVKMMAYEKLGNEEAVKECEQEIISIDKNRLTYFSKIFFNQ